MPLDDAYIIECEKRARRYMGQWTGTAGSLAADSMRLQLERRELVSTIDELRAELDGLRAKLDSVTEPLPKKRAEVSFRIIGLAGHIGAGKTAAASMIPGAVHLQWADAIYRGLAAMLDVPEEVLRHRTTKEAGVEVGGVMLMPRNLTRTLGTEWGRELVCDDLWVALALRRMHAIHAATGCGVFSVCGTRFANEAAAVRRHGGEVWWIDRPGIEPGDHRSDVSLEATDCDRVIVNRGTLDDLRRNVEAAWQDFIGGTA